MRGLGKVLLIAGLLLLAGGGLFPVRAQQAERLPRYAVRYSPQQLLVRGIHLEAERMLGTQNRHALVVAPRYYTGNAHRLRVVTFYNEPPPTPATVRGYGLEVLHKVYLSANRDTRREVAYVAYGAHAEHFRVRYQAEGWYEETGDDGLRYYKKGPQSYRHPIDRLGGTVIFGLQNPLAFNRLVWDVYAGLGAKHATGVTAYRFVRDDQKLINYSSSGLYLLLGLKVGVVF